MKEFNIKNMFMEEFDSIYKLNDNQKKDYFSCCYRVTEIANLIESSNGNKTFILIEDMLYEDPETFKYKDDLKSLVSKEDIEAIESLHDNFRDSLVDFREYLYSPNGEMGSPIYIKIQASMGKCINETKLILNKYNIGNEEKLKEISSKFFIPDFLNNLFGNNEYEQEYEIDCGA